MKNKILTIACVLFGLMFINAGLNKFLNYMPPPSDMPEDTMKLFVAITQITWLMPLIAVAEIAGGVLIMFKKFRALGAVIITPVMVGILLTHSFVAPEGLPMALILAAILVWVIIENKEKYMPMIKA